MALRFEICHRPNGSITATCGVHVEKSERALARALVEAGEPDAPVEGGRAGKTDWTAPSLHLFAAGALAEGDRGFTRGIYSPWPARELHPALQAAVDSLRAARARAAA